MSVEEAGVPDRATTASNTSVDDDSSMAGEAHTSEVNEIQFDPGATRPSFLWKVSLPTNWIYVNTHPEASIHQVQSIAEDFIPGRRFRRSEQKQIARQLQATIDAARKGRYLLTLILPGLNEKSEPSAATLFLRWYDSAPDYSSIGTVQRAFEASTALVEEQSSSQGSAYLTAANVTQTGPLSDRRSAYHRQAFIPVADTTWTLVASGTTPDADTDKDMAAVITRIANSVEVFPHISGAAIGDDAFADADDGETNFTSGINNGYWKE